MVLLILAPAAPEFCTDYPQKESKQFFTFSKEDLISTQKFRPVVSSWTNWETSQAQRCSAVMLNAILVVAQFIGSTKLAYFTCDISSPAALTVANHSVPWFKMLTETCMAWRSPEATETAQNSQAKAAAQYSKSQRMGR